MRYAQLSTLIALAALSLDATSVSAQSPVVREVVMTDRSIVPVATRVRFFTDLIFPEDEQILEPHCGDRDFWIVEVAGNVVRVKPAKEGASTIVDVPTASNRTYTFHLTESKKPFDGKIFVLRDRSVPPTAPRFVPVAEVERLQAALAEARAAADGERRNAATALETFKGEYPERLRFEYQGAKYEAPFYVRAIWNDGARTYLRTDARELPTLYELVDGRATVLNFQVRNGLYIVHKVLDRGYLSLGKRRWTFERR